MANTGSRWDDRAVPLLPVGLAVGGVLVGLVAARTAHEGAAFATPAGAAGIALLLVAGWAPIAAGLLHSARHPDRRRTLVLLVVAGLGWFVGELDNPEARSAVVFTAGLVLFAVGPAAVVHAALAFPTGRLPGRGAAVLVAVGYAVTLLLQGLAAALLSDPAAAGCAGCPTNLLVAVDDPGLLADVQTWGLRANAVWSAGAVLALAVRVASVGAVRRRTSGPVLAAAALDLALVAVAGFRELAGHVSEAGTRHLWEAQGLALLLVAVAVVGDLVRERRAQRALSALVVDLAGGTVPGSLRDAVVSRLGDPDVVLAFPVDAEAHLVDATGAPVDADGHLATELRFAGAHLATLLHGAFRPPRAEAVDELVSAVHLGLENERLHAEALAQVADLRRSGARLLAAGDEERRALERDLHDGAQQRLVGLALGLQLLRSQVPGSALAAADRELRSAIETLRQLGHGLYPVLLHDAGLGPALASLAETHDLQVDLVPDRRFPPAVETTVYLAASRVAARGPTRVSVTVDDSVLRARLLGQVAAADLAELTDRVMTLDGSVTVPDASGELLLTIPMEAREPPSGAGGMTLSGS